MPGTEAMGVVQELLESQGRGVLATAGEAGPHASLMVFAAQANGRRLIFATLRATRKYRNLQGDPRAALLIDSRSDAGGTAGAIVTATASGEAWECDDEQRSSLAALLIERHRRLEEFVREEDCAIMVLEVDHYRVVGRFQTGEDVEGTVGAEGL